MAHPLDDQQVGAWDLPRECLAVRKDAGINTLKDLKGKKIGMPFNTSVHFAMLAALKTVGLGPSDVTLINVKADSLLATWQRNLTLQRRVAERNDRVRIAEQLLRSVIDSLDVGLCQQEIGVLGHTACLPAGSDGAESAGDRCDRWGASGRIWAGSLRSGGAM